MLKSAFFLGARLTEIGLILFGIVSGELIRSEPGKSAAGCTDEWWRFVVDVAAVVLFLLLYIF